MRATYLNSVYHQCGYNIKIMGKKLKGQSHLQKAPGRNIKKQEKNCKMHLQKTSAYNIKIQGNICKDQEHIQKTSVTTSTTTTKQVEAIKSQLPFLSIQESRLILHKEAQEFLLSIPPQNQIAFIFLYGNPQSKKSLLANCALLNQKCILAINSKQIKKTIPTITLCTKTIKNDHNTEVIILEWSGPKNSVLLQLMLVLSSMIIMNTTQHKSGKEYIKDIEDIIENGYNLYAALKSSQNNSPKSSYLPQFLWVFSNAYCKIDYARHQQANALYPDYIFGHQSSIPYENQRRNKLRDDFKRLFNGATIMNLPEGWNYPFKPIFTANSNIHLSVDYLKKIVKLRQIILSKIKPKSINSINVNCRLAINFLKQAIQYFSVWNQSLLTHCKRLLKEAAERTDAMMMEAIEKQIDQKIWHIMTEEKVKEPSKRKLLQYVYRLKEIKTSNPQKFAEFIGRMDRKINQEVVEKQADIEERLRLFEREIQLCQSQNGLDCIDKIDEMKNNILLQVQSIHGEARLRYKIKIKDLFSKFKLFKLQQVLKRQMENKKSVLQTENNEKQRICFQSGNGPEGQLIENISDMNNPLKNG